MTEREIQSPEYGFQRVTLFEDPFIGKIVAALTVTDSQDKCIDAENHSYGCFVSVNLRYEAHHDERYNY